MNKRQKQVQQSLLKDELAVIDTLEESYKQAIADINSIIVHLLARKDTENLQAIIYQVRQQKALKKELETLLKELQDNNYQTIDEYLKGCYENAHIGTLFDLQGQGVPLMLPLDQEQMISAITLNSKISAPLYNHLGYNTDYLKVEIMREISRGIAMGLSYQEMARNLENTTNVDFNKSLRIAKTEGHRIQQEASYNVQKRAIQRGAKVVKQWDSTLDKKTRKTHRELDGQIVGVDEYFVSLNGHKALYPGDFGVASEDVNCRCCILQRAEWALDDGEFDKMNGFSGELEHFASTNDYNNFKKIFWSDENIRYMNYVETLEKRYETKDFKKVLSLMTDSDYKHYHELLDKTPMYK